MARLTGDAVSKNLVILTDIQTGVYHRFIEVPHYCEPLLEGLNGFRLDGSYCDVTIYVEGKVFQCHRAVLASVSEYFHRLFGCTLEESSSQMNFTLLDIDATSFDILLDVIYLGRYPDFNEDVIHGLLRSSKFLGMQNVKSLCVRYIMKEASSFSPVTMFKLFHLACGLNERSLLINRLSEYYIAFLKDFTQEDLFLEMAHNCLIHILQQYRASAVHFVDENFLLDAIVRWVFHNFQERRCHFEALVNQVNFNKISEDCAEYLLKKYKANCGTKLKSDNQAKVLKMFVLDGFSHLDNFINHDDTMPASYEDPLIDITPSLHVYGQELHNKYYQDMYTVFSLGKPESCDTETGTNPSDLSSTGDGSVIISCTFKMSTKHALVSSSKLNLIYCLFDTGIFRAYNTVDLSSATYTELASLSQSYNGEYLRSYCSKYTGACGTDDGDIYFSDKREIHRYNSQLDKWFPVEDLAGVKKCNLLVHDNLLYVIGGENPEGQILDKYIRTYDGRTSKWLELSRPEVRRLPYRCNASCIMDGKIYVYDGFQFKVFDPVAGKWMYIKDGVRLYHLWPGHSFSDRLIMIPYKKEVFIFESSDGEYLAYNPTTDIVKRSRMSSCCSRYRYFCFQNVISFEFMEM